MAVIHRWAPDGSEDGARLFDLHVSGPRAQAQAMAIEAAQRLRKKVEEGL